MGKIIIAIIVIVLLLLVALTLADAAFIAGTANNDSVTIWSAVTRHYSN